MSEITNVWAFAVVGWAVATIACFNGWRQAKRIEQNCYKLKRENK